ncbi:hypothetical protein DEO72_LG8g1907 [Vigna unguiculata]|uniref:Secreted protein n=1 Tax=Vigna unguiculata TaxID=3917 RepID=A0A4D6MS27_VIGUN|nr:hypothetical protein DEO72_LG8g1906 [Vigna unguiculata]QCE03878.1 hypothetical protein DEO72_LG8g1907 [Vigna unguiculata]
MQPFVIQKSFFALLTKLLSAPFELPRRCWAASCELRPLVVASVRGGALAWWLGESVASLPPVAYPRTAFLPPRRRGFSNIGGSRLLLLPLLPPLPAAATACPLIPSVVAALYWVVEGSSNCCITGLKN